MIELLGIQARRAAITLGLACIALSSTQAQASAYTMPKGEGRVIANVFWSNSSRGYDHDGKKVNIPDYEKIEAYALTEYGITDDLTAIFNPSLRRVKIDAPTNSDSFGLGFVELGARQRVVNKPGFVLSAQGTVRIPGSKRRSNFAQIGQTDTEYDARLQAGFGAGKTGFAIVEAGYRFRDGDPANEFRLDATLGFRPAAKFLVLAQSFNSISDGRGRGFFGKQRYHNAYLSGVYDVSEKVSVQVGAMATLAGRNALRERGTFAGLWFRF